MVSDGRAFSVDPGFVVVEGKCSSDQRERVSVGCGSTDWPTALPLGVNAGFVVSERIPATSGSGFLVGCGSTDWPTALPSGEC